MSHSDPPGDGPDLRAPDRLRRRVLVMARRGTPGSTFVARRCPRLGRARLAALLLTGAAALAVGLELGGGSGRPPPAARFAPSERGARASLSRAGGHLELSVSGVPEPPVGEIYEVWLARSNDTLRPTDALFSVTGSGKGSVEIPGSLRGVGAVVVTSEPEGGSMHPTGPTLLAVALPG